MPHLPTPKEWHALTTSLCLERTVATRHRVLCAVAGHVGPDTFSLLGAPRIGDDLPRTAPEGAVAMLDLYQGLRNLVDPGRDFGTALCLVGRSVPTEVLVDALLQGVLCKAARGVLLECLNRFNLACHAGDAARVVEDLTRWGQPPSDAFLSFLYADYYSFRDFRTVGRMVHSRQLSPGAEEVLYRLLRDGADLASALEAAPHLVRT